MTDSIILTAEQLRAADAYAVSEMGLSVAVLMERAADGLYKGCVDLLGADFQEIPVTFLCGKGNNGGDGFCLCARLAREGYNVAAVSVFGESRMSPDCSVMAGRVPDGFLIDASSGSGKEAALARLTASELVVDCVFGTGFSGDLPDWVLSLFEAAIGKKVLACDLPSGVCCDNGKVCGGTMKAEKTVTFAAAKPCCFLYPGKDYFGEIEVWDIGIARATAAQAGNLRLISASSVLPMLKQRPENSHKGTFGGVQMFCGSKWMTGAAGLSASSALKSGVGLVYVSSCSTVRKILQQTLFEPVYTKPKAKTKATALVAGCGLGKNAKIVKYCLKQKKPMVLDGDALNFLAKHKRLLLKKHAPSVLTPHPLEMSRLLGIPVAGVEADRIGVALYAAEKFSSVVVLKGRHTVIATPKGKVWINKYGNSALAKGGSGDVLAGFLGGLLASGYSAEEAAVVAVYAHSLAAENLTLDRSEEGILPSEIVNALDDVFFLKRVKD